MGIKLVVFDIAGTTVKDDHEVSKTFKAAMQKYGYNVELEKIDPLMGYEKPLAIRKMLAEYEADQSVITDNLVNTIHKEFVQQMINFYKFEPGIEPLPNVEATFAKLHEQGTKVGINTGFSRDIADTIINRLQWREKGLIDYMVGSDEVELGRPHPFMIRKMMQESNITNALEVAKVGDTEVDVREGQNAGCKYSIGVTTGAFTRTALEAYNPTHVIDDIAQVIEIINQ
ncbi:HAD hydrolase-like protein [Mucilaginibacter sp. SMC90]|uniref:HAD hydrolase-like protein n=1 Tax=Mucilaginibacter sp. SMC90 TaxID=2929803 RepID=UPI001FB34A29|nr:HAD hydrolase-like protein [Mucilaginibacter sp. SMC90]UOE50276.1 HAD hydrolase-like protein [Mucilaginibacter sp. SMC90]